MPLRAFIQRVNWITCGLCIVLAINALLMGGNKIVGLAALLGIVATIYNGAWVFRRRPPS